VLAKELTVGVIAGDAVVEHMLLVPLELDESERPCAIIGLVTVGRDVHWNATRADNRLCHCGQRCVIQFK